MPAYPFAPMPSFKELREKLEKEHGCVYKKLDGTLVDQRQSIYFPPPNAFVKPADLFIDGAVLIPEPGALATFALLALVLRRPVVTRASGPCKVLST